MPQVEESDAQRGAPMSHIALRPQQARELLTLMHAPFSREIREDRQGVAVGKGEPMVPVLHFRRPEQRNLQDTHANSSKCYVPVKLAGISYFFLNRIVENRGNVISKKI